MKTECVICSPNLERKTKSQRERVSRDEVLLSALIPNGSCNSSLRKGLIMSNVWTRIGVFSD